jgi:hypothetical protein
MVKKLIISLMILFQAFAVWSQIKTDTTKLKTDTVQFKTDTTQIRTDTTQIYSDSIVNEYYNEYEFAAYNSTKLIMKYYQVQDYDSALLVLNDWQTACGASEPITRTRILLAINDNAFDESVYDSTIVDDVLNYIYRMESKTPENLYSGYESYFGYVPIRGEYDYFTQSLADTLLSRGFDTPLELLFCQFYANIVSNPLKEIQTDALYNNTDIKKYYLHRANKCLSKSGFNFNLFTGLWIPTGNASLLGIHPLIGIQGGVKSNKMIYNLTLAFKFVNSANDYVILKDGYTDTTNYFFGGYIGLDTERELYKSKKHEIDLLAGIGYDGFESIKTDNNNSDPNAGHSINSLNTNFGLGYRYFYKKNTYIGLQAKYNIVNYNNKGGTNLMGDCLTVTISIGGLNQSAKENCLYDLRYTE